MVEIDKNGVKVCNGIKYFCNIVMWFYLCSEWVLG